MDVGSYQRVYRTAVLETTIELPNARSLSSIELPHLVRELKESNRLLVGHYRGEMLIAQCELLQCPQASIAKELEALTHLAKSTSLPIWLAATLFCIKECNANLVVKRFFSDLGKYLHSEGAGALGFFSPPEFDPVLLKLGFQRRQQIIWPGRSEKISVMVKPIGVLNSTA